MSAKLVLNLYRRSGGLDTSVELPPPPNTALMTNADRAVARQPWRERCHLALEALLEHVR